MDIKITQEKSNVPRKSQVASRNNNRKKTTTSNMSELMKRKSFHLKLNNNSDKRSFADISNSLIIMGYSFESINAANMKYKFETIEQAVQVMGLDPDTGLYQHNFMQRTRHNDSDDEDDDDVPKKKYNDKLCVICRDVKEKHSSLFNELPEATANLNTKIFDSETSMIKTEEYKNFKKDNDITLNKKQKKIPINSSFIQQLELEFQDKDLCIICFAYELDDMNGYRLPCGHVFCRSCIKNYLHNLISISKVENIKCLQAGCKNVIPDYVVEEIVTQDNFNKYQKFKKRSLFYLNIQKGYIPCTSPDCEEWVLYKTGDDEFVKCEKGHKFCAKCKRGWHKRINCKNKELERVTLENSRIKPCPNCENLIEKLDGCNNITCGVCFYEFCWLCMNAYTRYHYSMFNTLGCPGMRYAKPHKKSSWMNNMVLKTLWYILSAVLGLLVVALICFIYFFIGAPIELIKCYTTPKLNTVDDTTNISFADQEMNANGSDMNVSRVAYVKESNTKEFKIFKKSTYVEKERDGKFYCIVVTLFLVGILLQPFYLIFKFVQLLAECYKHFGCWIFFFYSGNTQA